MQKLFPITIVLSIFCSITPLSGQDHDLNTAQNYLDSLTNHQELDSSWEFVVAYNRLGDYYRQRKEYDEAWVYLLKGFELADKLGRTDYAATTRNYNYLIDICYQKGDIKKAVEILEDVGDFVVSHPEKKPVEQVNYYFQMGQIMRFLGESKRGIAYLEKAIFVAKNEPFEKRDRALTNLYKVVGFSYMDNRDLDKAIFCFKQCNELAQNQDGEKAAQMSISSLTSIGSALITKKEYQSAAQYLNKADSLLQIAVTQSEDTDYLFHEFRGIRWNQAELSYELGDLEQAKKYFLDLVNNYPVEGKEWHDDQAYYYLGKIHEKQGNLKAALKYNHQALIVSCKTFAAEDYFELPTHDDFREMRDLYSILDQKAQLLARASVTKSEKDKKRRHYVAALKASDLFDQLHANNLRTMNLIRDGQTKSLINQSTKNFQSGLLIAHDFYQLEPTKALLDKSFYYTQKMKAQQLWLTLMDSEATEFGKLPNELLAREKELLADIQHYEQKVLEAKKNQDSVALDLYVNTYLFDSKRAYNALIQEMESNYPEYYEAKYNFVPETDASLQNLLNEKELLLEYVFADSFLFIFTLAQNQPLQLQKIPLDTLTAEHIDAFNKRLQRSSWMRRSSREQFINLSYALYQQFVEPIADQIADKERLIIIGDGMTNYIPFEVLIPTDEFSSFQDLDYLIKKHEISYHYSASLFAKARKNTVTETSGVFAFAPVYDQTEPGLASAEVAMNQPSNSFRAFDQNGHYSPLPESEQEVKDIYSLFEEKNPNSNLLALRDEAHESALKANLEQPYRFVHLAGHSFADLDNPKFSGIACFEQSTSVQDSTEMEEDGTLYTGEIYNLALQADLVTLSSCESGYGKMEVSEGLLGLNRAFIYAGTPNVVFSLWKVYDKVSAELMVDFYENILSGKTYPASLRQAKLNLLKQEATAAPHFWAPYLFIGR